MIVEQKHLNYKDTINFGSYYTPENLVNIVYKMLEKNISNWNEYKILDTSCGYGNFLKFKNSIGADIDKKAIEIAKKNNSQFLFFNQNSLKNVSRNQYNLAENEKLIVVGNPPYNDKTSIIRNQIKQDIFEIDTDLNARDLGMSFLLSYDKIKADFVCVLHPLSYLIKKANFEILGSFKKNYKLKDSIIVSSGEFSSTSKTTQFPIIIALYERNSVGMNYDFICKNKFKTLDNKIFSLNQFDKISNYITKYPNQNYVRKENAVAYFWTMRDINALKRSRTFIENENYNTIRVVKDKIPFYCYVDVFKEWVENIPYYLGNSDIMINFSEFEKIKESFILKSAKKHNFLKPFISYVKNENYEGLIDNYFKNLLKEHYVDK